MRTVRRCNRPRVKGSSAREDLYQTTGSVGPMATAAFTISPTYYLIKYKYNVHWQV